MFNESNIDFKISLFKDTKLENNDDLLNEITIDLEEAFGHDDINRCLIHQEFGDIPITKIYRIFKLNQNDVQTICYTILL